MRKPIRIEKARRVTSPVPIDLRSITKDAELTETKIWLQANCITKIEWITLGRCSIQAHPRHSILRACTNQNLTDGEHDAAYALWLPLIGVQFESLRSNSTRLIAWVATDREDEFRVPDPGYDPSKSCMATACRVRGCELRPHVIVPAEFNVPPRNKMLYEAVRGKSVEIDIQTSKPYGVMTVRV